MDNKSFRKLHFIIIIVLCISHQHSYSSNCSNSKTEKTSKGVESSTLEQAFEIIPDNRPSDYEYAVLSEHIYTGVKQGGIVRIKQTEWQAISTKTGNNDYFGVIYKNEQKKQLVLVHRGTQSFSNVIEDFQSVVLNLVSTGQQAAYDLTKEAIAMSQRDNFHLSTTGHSLGALFAELSVYWCHDKFGYFDINAVTFESPGSRDLVEKRLLPNLIGTGIDLDKLDIVEYLSYPNLVNSWGHHIGTVYQIYPMLGDLGWVAGWYTKQSHLMSSIVKSFEEDVFKTCTLMQDWPLRSERENYFKESVFQQGKYFLKELDNIKEFLLYYKGHYAPATTTDQEKQLLLKHFNTGMRRFLTDFFQLHKHLLIDEESRKALVRYWKKNNIPDSLIDLITSFKIDEHRGFVRVNILSSKNVQNWRSELSLALTENSNLISKLLQPLKEQNTHKGLIIIEDNVSLENSVLNVRTFTGEIYRKYKGPPEAIDKARKLGLSSKHQLSSKFSIQLTTYMPQILTSYEKFIGREQELQKIEQALSDSNVVVITGRSGVGKTICALEYGKRHKTSKIIRYLNSDSATKIEQGYRELAQELNINVEQQDRNIIMRLVNNRLSGLNIEMLFIMDNIEDYDDVKDYLINLPQNIKVLGTTRHPRLIADKVHVVLDEFTNKEAAEYLKHGLQDRPLSQENMQKLVKSRLSSLPFDLKLAVTYLLNNPLTDSDNVTEEIGSKIKDKLFRQLATNKDKTIQQGWKILQYLSHLDPDFISTEITKELFPQKDDQISLAIKKLESLSLISIITDKNGQVGFRIHRSLQKAILLSTRCNSVHSLDEHKINNNLLYALDSLFVEIRNSPDIKWYKAIRIQPHVKKLLDSNFELTTNEAKINRANLYYKLALYYQIVSVNYKQALEYAEIALNQRRKLYQGNSLEVASVLNVIGTICRRSGDPKEGLKYVQEGLQMIQQLHLKDHPDISDSLYNIGMLYMDLGETRKGLKYGQMALEMNKRLYPGNHDKVASSLNEVGLNYIDLGNFEKSLDYLKESLKMFNELYSGNHREIAATQSNIAFNYHKLGNYEEAIKHAKISINMINELYPDGHPRTIYSLDDLAESLIELGNIEQALVALHQALEISKKFNMDKHYITAFVFHDLGRGYFKNKNYQQALECGEKALSLR